MTTLIIKIKIYKYDQYSDLCTEVDITFSGHSGVNKYLEYLGKHPKLTPGQVEINGFVYESWDEINAAFANYFLKGNK